MDGLKDLRESIYNEDVMLIKKNWSAVLDSIDTKDFDAQFLLSNLKSIDLSLKNDSEVIDIVKIHVSSLNTLLQITSI